MTLTRVSLPAFAFEPNCATTDVEFWTRRLVFGGRLVGAFAQVVIDQREQQLEVKGLREVLVGAGVTESTNLARGRVGRKDDDRNVRGRGVHTQLLQHVEAVDVG